MRKQVPPPPQQKKPDPPLHFTGNESSRLKRDMALFEKALKIAIDSLEQAKIDINAFIENEYPSDIHPIFYRHNTSFKIENSAQIGLDKIDNLLKEYSQGD